MIRKIAGTTIAATATTYASADCIGTKFEIANLNRGVAGMAPILTAVTVTDLDDQQGALDVILFDSDPSATTFTDDAALDIADADLTKIIGMVKVTSSDYSTFNDNAVGQVHSIGLAIDLAGGSSAYGVVVSRDAKTYTANGIGLHFHFME